MNILFLLLLLAGILILRTIILRKSGSGVPDTDYTSSIAPAGSTERLSKMIQLKTVTYNDFSKIDMKEHRKIEGFSKENFPKACSALNMKKLNDFAYIFRWEGTNKKAN